MQHRKCIQWRSTESNNLLHGASLFPVISIVTESNTSRANNTIKANCCCVLQPLLAGTAGRVGVIDHRCFSFSVPVYHWGITVDGQDEVSGFLVQVSHSSSGTSTISFSSFIIFALHGSKIKVWVFFSSVRFLFQHNCVIQGKHFPKQQFFARYSSPSSKQRAWGVSYGHHRPAVILLHLQIPCRGIPSLCFPKPGAHFTVL